VEDTHYVDGLVFRKNVTHKAMRGAEGGREGGRGGGKSWRALTHSISDSRIHVYLCNFSHLCL